MKTKLQFIIITLVLGVFSMQAQTSEVAPYADLEQQYSHSQRNTQDLFNFEFNFAIDASLVSMVGILYFNDQYWTSQWNADTMAVLDSNGVLVETFTIAGVTGIRSITTDGTNLFLGGAGAAIYEINPTTRTLISTINITTGSTAAARMCTYDETLDGGNGGFWIGNFGSDIASVDMNGNELSVIAAATHGTAVYGGAIDNFSDGGPFLWIHDQTDFDSSQDHIVQIDPSTGAQTGVMYDYQPDSISGAGLLAGGLSISSELVANKVVLLGMAQTDPSEIFAVELIDNTTSASIDSDDLLNFSVYPNPTNTSTITIETPFNNEMQVSVFNMLGARVMESIVSNNKVNISSLNSGVYMIKVKQNNKSATKKLIVN